jgi:hypothetical protein
VSQSPHYYTPPQTKAFYQFYGHLPNHLCAMWPSWFVCAIHLCPYSIIKNFSSHVSQSPHYYTPPQIEAFYQSYGCESSPWSNVCYVGLIVPCSACTFALCPYFRDSRLCLHHESLPFILGTIIYTCTCHFCPYSKDSYQCLRHSTTYHHLF